MSLRFLLLLSLIQCAFCAEAERGFIRSELFNQHLSHLAFHSGTTKLTLADLFASDAPRTVAVVGVEWGSEVSDFAERSYIVHAIEPLPNFVSHLERLIASNSHWNVHLHPYAAVAERDTGNITLSYDNAGAIATVRTAVLDDLVDAELDVLSVDVQGAELDVLLGAKELLAGPVPRVRSLVRNMRRAWNWRALTRRAVDRDWRMQ